MKLNQNKIKIKKETEIVFWEKYVYKQVSATETSLLNYFKTLV